MTDKSFDEVKEEPGIGELAKDFDDMATQEAEKKGLDIAQMAQANKAAAIEPASDVAELADMAPNDDDTVTEEATVYSDPGTTVSINADKHSARMSVSEESVKEVNETFRQYKDKGLVCEELKRLKKKIEEKQGVTQQMRTSMESYLDDADVDALPAARMYTVGPSLVNYDRTLNWVVTRTEQTQQEQLRLGVKFTVMALKWLRDYAIQPRDNEQDTLRLIMMAGEAVDRNNQQLIKDINIDPSDAEPALANLITSLELDPEKYDSEFIHGIIPKAKARKVYTSMVTPYVGETLTGITNALVSVKSLADEFNDYQLTVKEMTKKLINSLKDLPSGDLEAVDLSLHEGGIQAVVKKTNKFTLLQSEVGVGHPVDAEYINKVIKTGYATDKLIADNEKTLSNTLNALLDEISKAYNLEELPMGTVVESKTPSATLTAMDENNIILSNLIDAFSLLASVYNSLVTTAVKKNNLDVLYSVYLEALVE